MSECRLKLSALVGMNAEHLVSVTDALRGSSAKGLRLCAVKSTSEVDTPWTSCGQRGKTKPTKQNTLTRWGVGRSFRLPFGTERQTAAPTRTGKADSSRAPLRKDPAPRKRNAKRRSRARKKKRGQRKKELTPKTNLVESASPAADQASRRKRRPAKCNSTVPSVLEN